MLFLPRLSLAYPKITLTLCFAVTLAAALGIPRLSLRTDGFALIPENDPAIITDRRIRADFDHADPLVVLIRTQRPEGIFHPETLDLVRDLTDALGQLPGIRPGDITSLATEKHFRYRPGTLKFQTLLEQRRTTDYQLQEFRRDLDAIQLYTGTLVSDDGSATAVYISPPDREPREIYAEVRRTLTTFQDRPEKIDVIGAPAAETQLGLHLLEDLGVPPALWGGLGTGARPHLGIGLVPLAMIVMIGVFLIAFRNLPAAMLPLMEAGAALVFSFGIMGWFGVPVYLTTTVMPIILVAMGVTDEIHLFHRYRTQLASGREHRAALEQTMREMWQPVVKTSLTTMVGFLSFAASPLLPVRAFGLFTALGIFFCMVWSLAAIPAMLTLIHPRWLGKTRPARPLPRLTAWGGRSRIILTVTLVAVLLSAIGVSRLTVQDSWTDGFDPRGEFHQATTWFDEHFHGAHVLLLALEARTEDLNTVVPQQQVEHGRYQLPGNLTDKPELLAGRRISIHLEKETEPGQQPRTWRAYIQSAESEGESVIVTTPRRSGSPKFWLRPAEDDHFRVNIEAVPWIGPPQLKQTDDLRRFLEARPEVGAALGPNDYLETTAFMIKPFGPDARQLPDDAFKIMSLWSKHRFMRGDVRQNQIISKDYGETLVNVFVRNADFRKVADLMAAVESFRAEHLEPAGIRLTMGGDLAVSQTLIEGIITTQYRSLILSLVGIFLVGALSNRSWKRGLLVLLPCALAVWCQLGIMGWLNIPIGVATSMFAGMTLGIGVDFAVHFLDRHALASAQGKGPAEAISDALTHTAPANLVNALALALGFGLLVMSHVPANARLGILLTCGVFACLAASLMVLPALRGLLKSSVSVPTNG
ncbi:MAG: MMPL family transporter [Acidobacteriota bacterium]|nr:MMPL family transporter [Acidobacteriota bacterium]